ncbi:type I polyketide synthase [Corynebacterium sp. HMSC070H05]|uniref:type I polyketide synthase n=1 Tax=Corynebacterium sp. HMSC070H05 TaxID=1715096 RepID=UPI0008A9079D|nr:type I polyketide synthase [Corynebacterium sp. HMSC070H05]OHQ53817.1 type I polyketide synthase [Corynebacterium sp. HMSC070H05]
MNSTSFSSLKRPAILFPGQGSSWQQALADAAATPVARSRMEQLLNDAQSLTAAVARPLASVVPGVVQRIREAMDADAAHEAIDALPAVSAPAILLSQIVAAEDLEQLGLDTADALFAGHSQGILGAAALDRANGPQAAEKALAFAFIMGAAATNVYGAADSRSRMLSVRGLTPEQVGEFVVDTQAAPISVINGHRHVVLSGSPEALAQARKDIEAAASRYNAKLEVEYGGSEITPVFDSLDVAYPFHVETNAPGVDLAQQWADACGITFETTTPRELAQSILVDQFDFTEVVRDLIAQGASHIFTFDSATATIVTNLANGSGVAVLDASTAAKRDDLARPGAELPQGVDYSDYAPRVIALPDGKTYTQTKFSSLTGLSPIILGGMTPTSADGEIVAAAANAGYWAELAGGGMYSEEEFGKHTANLKAFLQLGRTAQFNTMFFDRFLWNLQFGQTRMVPKARAAGAPFNGVCISAGIPEVEEATELFAQLHQDGFPYIALKPGTTQQIRNALAIAAANPDDQVILMVEDGHAGGHHSWVDLEDMLLETYPEIRAHDNAVLTVGGGVYSPERAAELITGRWSEKFGLPAMPVDGVFVGTVAMATKEAKATDSVKQLLVDTPGLPPENNGGWVGRGRGVAGVASSQSHLLADLHDLDNSFAKAARFIASLDIEEYAAHREEIIEALSKTAKPYFGDVETMTYAEWVERFVELADPFIDQTWNARFVALLQRIEARLNEADHGEIPTLFPDDVEISPREGLQTLLQHYPQACEVVVSPRDAAWWIGLHYAYPKPMPWVPALDADLKSWFGKDTLWQAQDERYTADQVRIIPGPVAVAGITRKNEPVAQLLARFEDAATQMLIDDGVTAESRFARRSDAADEAAYLRSCPTLVWHGHLMANPAYALDEDAFDVEATTNAAGECEWTIRIHADSAWDHLPEDKRPFYVREVNIPVEIPAGAGTGASPVVDGDRLSDSVFELLSGLAGVGSVSEAGDTITEIPQIEEPTEDAPFGVARSSFTLPASLLASHSAVTGGAVADNAVVGTPDVLVGPCWPAIYAALGSGRLADGTPVIEGLLNAVHLDHVIDLRVPLSELADGRRIDVTSKCTSIAESTSGRIVTVELELRSGDEVVATQMQRFAIRGRATGTATPVPAPAYGGGAASDQAEPTPRSFVDRTVVRAPSDMTPFALVSGDYNPIHTSANAAALVNLDAPLVHGMWLSATAQHLAAGHGQVIGWTYSMYGMVQLDDEVEITVERVGRVGIQQALEVTCRIAGDVVSRGQALLAQPRTAYVYPGQGIQTQGMGNGDRAASAAAREVWRRADRHTRETHGFSIQRIVEDNPSRLVIRGVEFKHPDGVLHLTQFTQVAMAVVAYAQTQRLNEANALASGAYFAGHSLGEYTALAALGNIFDLEAVIDIVYSRGSAMGSLVPRDAEGNSDYGMGALRPNMIGVGPEEVEAYVAGVAQDSGEFLEIVNYNIKGQQYSVAGTKRGLAALERKANSVTPRAYVTVPGVDVPFHSRVLREGVADFAEKLDEHMPAIIDVDTLVDRYIPNLVAKPFALTQQFIDAVTDEVPSERLKGMTPENTERNTLARTLLIELLAWQFASPVRWIETQDYLLGRVDQVIEVGLASSPTLTNLAKREMDVIGIHVPVFNVEASQDIVMLNDVVSAPEPVLVDDTPAETDAEPAPESAPQPAAEAAPAAPAAPAEPVPAAPAAPAASGAPASDLPFTAADAITVLFALQNKIRPEQINDSDTIEELTGGVSSRRNQLLMDMSAELGVPAIDGAAEADVATLNTRVNTAAPGYTPFGAVLSEAVGTRLRQLFGGAGLKPAFVGEHLAAAWGLPASWTAHVEAEILLGSRTEESVRGGSLNSLPSATTKAEITALIDQAVQNVAARYGVAVSQATSGGASGGGVVDSAALDAYKDEVTDTLVATARTLLNKLGIENEVAEIPAPDTTIVETIEAELGSGWVKQVTPVFDERKAVLFDDRWAQAREDLARVALGELDLAPQRFAGTGSTVAKQAEWYAKRVEGDRRNVLGEIAAAANAAANEPYANDVALVTGAAPGSIATAVVEGLLAGGATVIMTASNVSQARKEFARTLFAEHASVGARLWLVPTNLSSYRDIDALIEWIGSEQKETVGKDVKIIKPALTPTLAFPFAAPPVSGSLAEVGGNAETQARLLLWSVERTIAGLSDLAQRGDHFPAERAHIVLPGSPNRGTFGGDGAYGEVKAAFDAIVNKWSAETGWPEGVTLAQARIGWVAGTHLMGGNDGLVPAAQAAGIHVWSPEEISTQLLSLVTEESREQAKQSPLDLDLTGGLEDAGVSIADLARNARVDVAGTESSTSNGATVRALPNVATPRQPAPAAVGDVTCALDDMVVVVGIGEVSSWGSGRTRREAEYGITRTGEVDLTAAGVLELAWMMGLITWSEDPNPAWYDEDGAEVAEEDIYERFRDDVIARSGIRTLTDKYFLTDQGSIDLEQVYLDRDITFTVATEEEALAYVEADGEKTTIRQIDGEWSVTRHAGALAHVPKKATLTRTVAGQMPDGFDPTKWGIPAQMADGMDRMAAWNLVTAVDAFINAGFTPAELMQKVHPSFIATTQGTGIGGMESLHKVFVSRFIGEERQTDILQEALPNVVAAHTMQALVGGYGSMIHPVGACATAAVSIEEAVDKIALGKADFVVAGGIDDVQVESLQGFGDMNATAETAKMTAQGIDGRFISRANDRRRGGFLEAEGGGTVLLARGTLAAELGLPVLAVVAYASSFGDGAHTSIPAPGLGVLAAACGGTDSRLARSLSSLGLTPDDVTVLSKHDTSTNANDPNESELHSVLWPAVGRDPDAPMYVISQKTLTGHSKAGAALLQTGGLLDVLATGDLPPNASLDCVDPLIEPKATNLVWLRSPLALGAGNVKAAALTSLGFGHVGALVVLGHPGVFEAALTRDGRDAAAWRERATERLAQGASRLEAGMIGRADLFTQVENRRFAGIDDHADEITLLLNPDARLNADGTYPTATPTV